MLAIRPIGPSASLVDRQAAICYNIVVGLSEKKQVTRVLSHNENYAAQG